MKRCSKCGQEFPATTEYFYARPDSPDGLRNECRRCHKERREKYYRETIDARHDYGRRYYQLNRQRLLEKQRAYEAQNRQQARARVREWRQRHPHGLRRWLQDNPTKRRTYYQRRKARKANRPDNFTQTDWQFALDYFGGCCAVCGRAPGLWHTIAADHWIPLSNSNCPGSVPGNIVPLCHGNDGCNNGKNARDAEEWLTATLGKRKAAAILLRITEFFAHVRQLD